MESSTLEEYAESEQLRLPIAPAHRSLHGVVRARAGSALQGVTVCFLKASAEVRVSGACVDTDGAGQFGFSELPSEARSVLASRHGYRPHREILDPATTSLDLVIELDAGGESVTGRVVDASGGSVLGALVTLRGNGDAAMAVASSALEGRFELASSPGAVEVCAQAEAYSRTCSALGDPSEEHVLVLTPESKIVGRVRSKVDGSGIVGASVVASNRNGLRVPARTTSSGDDGTFTFDALPAGGYELVAVSGNARSSEQWVAVGLGETSADLTLWAAPAVRLRARILVGGIACPVGSIELAGPLYARGFTSETGHVEVAGVIPGRYDATADCDGALSQSVSLDIQAAPVEQVFDLVQLGDSSRASAATAPNGGTIQATVAGEPSAAFAAFVQSGDGSLRRGRRNGAKFVFEQLPVGEYRVYLDDNVEQARPARIAREGEVVDVQLQAAEKAWLRGRVTSDEGVPIADAWVSASRSDLISTLAGAPPTLTAADGSFNLAAVARAPYTLTVASPFGDAELHSVKAGDELQVRVRAPASLSGRVQTAQGRPVPDFTLTYRAERDASGYERRGANSAFNLPMLEPDTYTLQVTSPLGSALEQVRLGPRQAATITLTLSEPPRSTTD
jgi:hypothetical protein